MQKPVTLALGIDGFSYADLYDPARLRDLYERWRQELSAADAPLFTRYEAYRGGAELSPIERSELLCALAPAVSRFVARLFGVEAEWQAERDRVAEDLKLFRFKDEFVKRRALKKKIEAPSRQAGDQALAALGLGARDLDDERKVAVAIVALVDQETELKRRAADDPELVGVRAQLAALEEWALARKDELARSWLSFKFPPATPDALHLVELERDNPALPDEIVGPEHHRRERHGFQLTDRRMTKLAVLNEVDYCLYCHDRDKDSCSKGLRDAKSGAIKPNALGIDLNGCPLDEKISEMHFTKRAGDSIGALALVCIDNPMCPGTGHRICNDCMKACIYQKQKPVDIPQIETAVLTDVLGLPWGLEIYGLLTRWNPLNVRRPYALPYRGKDVLVVGLGPAGYTLAHHLLNEGFGVIGIDGLKLEPLPPSLVGDPKRGVLPEPVRAFEYQELDNRVLLGFGGVSEYGITVRWDKNFLQLIYTTLLRRRHFRAYGGVRFGGSITLDDAWQLGFAHVAIAAGAGKPTIIDIENNLIRGVRKASDFLMALQLQGAYKRSSLANLQVRLPGIIIGGGLTAIDTATEMLAYYVVQAEKALERHESLVAGLGEERVWQSFDAEERQVLEELVGHGRAIRAERQRAAAEKREPRLTALLQQWGGVAICYRKKITDSPAYRLNHEEVEKCLEEGVRFIESMSPVAAVPDERGAVKAMRFKNSAGELVELPARTVCVAAGTAPNTIYEKEHPGTFALDKRGYFAPHTARRNQEDDSVTLAPDPSGFFTSYEKDGRTVSYYGDNHPRYAGSVVKAMASAKHGFPHVAALFADVSADVAGQAAREQHWQRFSERLDEGFSASVVAVHRLTPTIVEVVVKAPFAARRFHPGQFYRLQNFETESASVNGTRLTMEGLALTGAWTDVERGLLSLIVLEMGSSSRLVAALRPGEPVVVMGPTGTPTEIPEQETVVLAGGGLGNAVLFSIGKALRAAGCKVIYFAAYRKAEDVFKVDDIEAASDVIIWSTDEGPAVTPRRAQDRAFVGNVVQAMVAYENGSLGAPAVPFGEAARIIAIGSDRMMRAVKEARYGVLAGKLAASHHAIASINSPMQCMMKEVCAQCLQKHIDPVTGKETVVFSCYNQDQPMDHVDFTHLAQRLRLNTVQEKLTNLWLEKLLSERDIRRI